MATNYVKSGEVMTFTAPSGGLTAGTPKQIEEMVVMPLTTGAENAEVECSTGGIWRDVPKATGATWTKGERLYWHSGNGNFTTAAASAVGIGFAAEDAISGATTGSVFIVNSGWLDTTA